MQVATVINGRRTKRAQKVTGDVVLNIFGYTLFGVPTAVLVILTLCAAKITVRKPQRFSIMR